MIGQTVKQFLFRRFIQLFLRPTKTQKNQPKNPLFVENPPPYVANYLSNISISSLWFHSPVEDLVNLVGFTYDLQIFTYVIKSMILIIDLVASCRHTCPIIIPSFNILDLFQTNLNQFSQPFTKNPKTTSSMMVHYKDNCTNIPQQYCNFTSQMTVPSSTLEYTFLKLACFRQHYPSILLVLMLH